MEMTRAFLGNVFAEFDVVRSIEEINVKESTRVCEVG